MGRAKLQMKRIESTTSRQVTFSKRRNGVLKKAYELSTLCDVEIALLMFSPAGRLTQFSTQKRIEDVFARFVDLSNRERENALAPQCLDQEHLFGILQDKEHVIRSLNQLRPVEKSSEFEELSREICSLQQQLQLAEEHLRMFEPDLGSMTSMEELESCEKLLEDLLNSVTNRKGTVLSSLKEGQSSQRSAEVLNWLPDGSCKGHTLDSPIVNVDTRDDISTSCVPLEESSCNLNLGNMKDDKFQTSVNQKVPAWAHSYNSADISGYLSWTGRNSGAEYPDVMPLNEELKTGELAKHETKMLLQD